MIMNFFIDRKVTSAVISGTLKNFTETKPDYKSTHEGVSALVKEINDKFPNLEVHKLGAVVVNDSFRIIAGKDLKKLMPLSLFFICIILFLHFKNIAGVMIPMLVVILDIIATLGLSGLFGIKLNNLIINSLQASSYQLVLSILYIFYTLYFSQIDLNKEHKEAIKYSIAKNLVPTILTTLTTAIGFYSLCYSEIVPIKTLGLLARIWMSLRLDIISSIRIFYPLFA